MRSLTRRDLWTPTFTNCVWNILIIALNIDMTKERPSSFSDRNMIPLSAIKYHGLKTLRIVL
jgi:hypothetical protein